jgi:hypothetical protein
MAEATQSTQVKQPTPTPQLLPQDGLLVEQLAAALEEPSFRAHTQIQRIVAILGREEAEQLANQASVLHTGAGLLTLDGKRQRTLGGIFFWLAKEQATDEQRLLIFPSACSPAHNRQEAAPQSHSLAPGRGRTTRSKRARGAIRAACSRDAGVGKWGGH